MAILELAKRQPVVFDPANAEHRRAYQKYLADRSWGHVNERFILDQVSLNLPAMCERKLTEYYLEQEFSKTGKRK